MTQVVSPLPLEDRHSSMEGRAPGSLWERARGRRSRQGKGVAQPSSVLYTLLAGTLILISGCGSSGPPPAMEVGGVGYTEMELGALPLERVQELATLTAFGVAVSRSELPRLVAPAIERERQRLLLRHLIDEISLRESGVDDDDLEGLYAADPEYELRVRHLVVLSERWRSAEERAEARARVEEALAELESGADFVELAARYSEEPGAAERGGLLEPGRRGTWVDEFWEAALSLEIGTVSGVVETPYGFHLLRPEERSVVPLSEVRYEVLGRLVDLEGMRAAADSWIAEYTSTLEVDREAALRWWSGELSGDEVLASWRGGEFRASSMERYLASLESEAYARFVEAPEESYLEVVRARARNEMLLAYTAELGIELTEKERVALAEEEREAYQEQAQALGFQRGADPESIKGVAMRALSSTAQRILIAKREVLSAAPAARSLYPVDLAAGSESMVQ